MANGMVKHYRPRYATSVKGGTQNKVHKLSDYEPVVGGANPVFGREADNPDGMFPAMIQVFGHAADDQAGGDTVKDMWSFWCLNRGVRQGDLFLLLMNPH